MSARFGCAWLHGVLLCLNLAGCGGSGSGTADSPPPPSPSISFDPAETSFTADRSQPAVTPKVVLTLKNTTTTGLVLFGDYTKVAIRSVDVDLRGPTLVPLVIRLRPTSTLFNGTYTDQIIIHACLDQACTQPLDGSPLTIPVTYTVTGTDPNTGATGPPSDAEATPLPVQSRVALTHNVRDAEYSRSLDQIVMVATYPANALWVYDAATGTEKSLLLAKAPTSVSVSPDGLKAAVGHQGLISVVDLRQVGQQPSQSSVQLTLTETVFDLALDQQGRVHFISDRSDEADNIHTVDIATGAEVLSGPVPLVYGQTYLRLHPFGKFLFQGDPLLSPSKLDKWDITGPVAKYVTSGSFEMAYVGACGLMWFNESGSRMYSQCGQVFETESLPNVDLARLGRLALSGPETTIDAFTITWMDQLAARNEISLIEADAAWCNTPAYAHPCYFRVGTFDSELLTRHTTYALAPMTVDGTTHLQHGLFVFYKADGTSKFLLSRLDAMSNPATEYYLSIVD